MALRLWLIGTESRSVLVYRRSFADSPTFDEAWEVAADEVLGSPLLPDFGVPVESLFVW